MFPVRKCISLATVLNGSIAMPLSLAARLTVLLTTLEATWTAAAQAESRLEEVCSLAAARWDKIMAVGGLWLESIEGLLQRRHAAEGATAALAATASRRATAPGRSCIR